MFLKNRMKRFTGSCSNELKRLADALQTADGVLIGAGAGLSTSAGFVYNGERFHKSFSDFERKYGFQDMYSGGFYPYDSLEEHWAYWSRYIRLNRYTAAPKPVYEELFELVKDKDYFVLTTNVDHQFQKAGFDKKRLFYTQGDYGLFQCSEPCCQETYDNEEIVRQMVEQQADMRIPTELIPTCPHCGKPMSMNLRSDDTFVQDAGWYAASKRYEDYVRRHMSGKMLYLELGVGYNTPSIIKYNFWSLTGRNPAAVYACLNAGETAVPNELKGQALCLDGDIGALLKELSEI